LKEPAPIDYNRADDTICNSTPAMRRWDDMIGWQQLWSDAEVEQEAILIFENLFIWKQNIFAGRRMGDLNATTESAVPAS